MITATESLLSTIEEKRPLVLLLGEDAWSDSVNGDPLLVSILEKLGRRGEEPPRWAELLTREALTASHYSWLVERFERRVHPPYVEVLREMPWSAVFTSSIDPTLVGLFSNRGREVEPVLTTAEHPRVARSTARPPLFYLFSRAGELDPNARPPTDQIELMARRTQHALQLLDRIRDTATPLGTIAVEGFLSGDGWLKFEDILGSLASTLPNQVLWFGGRPRLSPEDQTHFAILEQQGRILVEDRRLGSVAAELRATGRLADVITPQSEDAGRVTFGPNAKYEVTPEVRLRVEAVASIIDDSWTSFLTPLGPDSLYESFRRFHGDLGGPRLAVEGIRRGFAIERDFEQELLAKASAALADHSKVDSP